MSSPDKYSNPIVGTGSLGTGCIIPQPPPSNSPSLKGEGQIYGYYIKKYGEGGRVIVYCYCVNLKYFVNDLQCVNYRIDLSVFKFVIISITYA